MLVRCGQRSRLIYEWVTDDSDHLRWDRKEQCWVRLDEPFDHKRYETSQPCHSVRAFVSQVRRASIPAGTVCFLIGLNGRAIAKKTKY